MRGWLELADGLVRAEPWVGGRPWSEGMGGRGGSGGARGRADRLLAMVGVMVGFGLIYGAMMGSYGGVTPARFEQMAYSALKVPVLLAVTFAVSLPSFFVINTLLGLREDWGQVVRALVATQAGLAVVLASLGPLTVMWYWSVPDYGWAKLWNGVMFLIASVAGQVQLARHYRPMVARRRQHRWAMRLWLVVYAFVGIQLAWVLRPFIGAVDLETSFFRADAWTNAYVEVAELVWSQLTGR